MYPSRNVPLQYPWNESLQISLQYIMFESLQKCPSSVFREPSEIYPAKAMVRFAPTFLGMLKACAIIPLNLCENCNNPKIEQMQK
jgi:hypothetical protein